MIQKTGNKEFVLILLVGFCLNLSYFHSHSLWSTTDLDQGHIPHQVVQDRPDCPACQHIIAGADQTQESSLFYQPPESNLNTGNRNLIPEQRSSTESNKSPPHN